MNRRRVLFVVTTRDNMGDLALCQEWIGDLGRERYRFAFLISENHRAFIDPADDVFLFRPLVDVGETIAATAARFRPDAVILASNSFWSMPGQRGAVFGRFPEELYRLGVPLLSFDPFEIDFSTTVPYAKKTLAFPPVPPSVWRLQYMSRFSDEPNALHFCTRGVFERARAAHRDDVLRRWGADPAKRTVIFPVSTNRFRSILEAFPLYYLHLAKLFSCESLEDAQFLVVTPSPIPGLRHARNVTFIPHVPFDDFLQLVAASDVYLSDSLISCMVNAFHLAVPVLLLANSAAAAPLARGTFLDPTFFPYKVFPYGFTEVCDRLIERFEIEGCFVEAEVLDVNAFGTTLGTLLYDDASYRAVADRCRAWKAARLALPGPRVLLEAVLGSGVTLTA
jgi:hypothetical protein